MNANALVQCRVSAEMKAAVEAAASGTGSHASEWLRALLRRELAAAVAAEVGASGESVRSERITIRLRPGDGARLQQRARRRSMKGSTYAAAVLRAHLVKAPPIPDEEVALLKVTLARLSNLDRALRERDGSRDASDRLLTQTRHEVGVLRDELARLVRRNAESWDTPDA
ncbi:MAG: hypothetical protein RJA99_3328 [Pseudomonadota bacterium]|jgi:hypothetical protein